MAVIPIIQQTWDTTSYVNPTRMNNIETNLGILSKATGIEYSSGVSVKDKIDEVDGKTADDIPYDSNNSVKDKIDDMGTVSSKTITTTYGNFSIVKMGRIVFITWLGNSTSLPNDTELYVGNDSLKVEGTISPSIYIGANSTKRGFISVARDSGRLFATGLNDGALAWTSGNICYISQNTTPLPN